MGINKLTIRDIPLENNIVLLRADYNVPLLDDGDISDDYRIQASLPTLNYLLDRGCKVVIISHLGRPEGVDSKLSLEPIAQRLAKLLKKDVRFVDKTVGDKVRQAVKRSPANSVIVLENLRFSNLEEQNDENFAKDIALSSGAKYFVQDGFGVVHRAHASTDAITHYLPSVAGLLLEKEYDMLTSVINNPKRPLFAIFGGAKVSDKIAVIEKFIELADKIIIAGAMANTFMSYKGYKMGASKVEANQTAVLDKIYKLAKEKVGQDKTDSFILLPVDFRVSKSISKTSTVRIVDRFGLQPDDIALDLGPKSSDIISREIKQSKTVLWNGTLGYAEINQFAESSADLADAISTREIISII
ncbi:MAG: phosphoglycerate kinase, partial [Alphaproteobacteria bacterium]|nr:phosphoglycerate kinase [Alphaproteobacteria bacterium]